MLWLRGLVFARREVLWVKIEIEARIPLFTKYYVWSSHSPPSLWSLGTKRNYSILHVYCIVTMKVDVFYFDLHDMFVANITLLSIAIIKHELYITIQSSTLWVRNPLHHQISMTFVNVAVITKVIIASLKLVVINVTP